MKSISSDHKSNRKNKFPTRYFVNQQIRANQVRCIDQNNINCGLLSLSDALSKARNSGLDLVQIAKTDNIPTCRIVDYGKFKYEQSKKERQQKKRQRETAVKIKELKLRPSTGDNDLLIKAKQAEKFLTDGHRVKLTVVFRGREMAHRQVGRDILDKFVSFIPGSELLDEPSMSGRNLTVIIGYKASRKESTTAA